MSNSDTLAGCLAALYADPADPRVQEEEPWAPSIEMLHESLVMAIDRGHDELAAVIAAEIRRMTYVGRPATRGELVGSAAGLWRVH